MSEKRKAALFFFVHVGLWEGIHTGAWRMPGSSQSPALDFEAIKNLTLTAERGKLHGVFLSDILALPDLYTPEGLSKTVEAEGHDPFVLTSALAAVTDKIGLALTANTTYNEPYLVARKFASLDHISGGRTAWNVVAGANNTEAHNFNQEAALDHETRYRRAAEFVDVVTGLWDGWDDDAFQRNKETGEYFDVDKLHPLDHEGEFFQVAGPLTVPRPVQGHPVIAQAGSSAPGLEFAARIGEIVFTHQHEIESARAFYADFKEKVAANGRNPDHVVVLPSITFLLGKTQEEADAKLAQLDELADASVGLVRLASLIDYDLSGYPLDEPVPEIPVTKVGSQTLQKLFVDQAHEQNMTVREFAKFALRAGTLCTTPEGLADRIDEWVTTRAADGFNMMMAESSTLDLFVDEVVPELQRRGVFHEDYEGSTLREYLGLPRPVSRFATAELTTA